MGFMSTQAPGQIGFELDFTRKRFVLKLFFLVGIPLSLFFIVQDLLDPNSPGRYSNIIVLAVFVVMYAINRHPVGEQETYRRIVYSLSIITVVIGSVFIYQIGYRGNIRVFTWMYIFPLLAFNSIGWRAGRLLIVMFFLLLSGAAVVFSPFPQTIQHAHEIIFRFFASFILLIILASIQEYYSFRERRQLLDQQIELEHSQKELLESSQELRNEIEERRRTEDRLREEKNKLKEAMSKIKVLSGLLPICAHCKKIRDDDGYWNQIESYIDKHSDAEFSHSVCPDCVGIYYADLFPEPKK